MRWRDFQWIDKMFILRIFIKADQRHDISEIDRNEIIVSDLSSESCTRLVFLFISFTHAKMSNACQNKNENSNWSDMIVMESSTSLLVVSNPWFGV